MKFKRSGYRDDLLFLVALALPAIVAAARYFETERSKDQIARGRAQAQAQFAATQQRDAQARLRLAEAPDPGR